MENFRIEKRKIQVNEYQALRQTTGWLPIQDASVEKALQNDLFSVCVLQEDRIVGMGRVIGDGAIYFYIQDVIVHPDFRGKGVARMIMDAIEEFLAEEAGENAFLGLMAAEGVQELYEKYGYAKRPPGRPGMFRIVRK